MMSNKEWNNWQKEIIHEEYVKPVLLEEKLQQKIEEVNKKYSSRYKIIYGGNH